MDLRGRQPVVVKRHLRNIAREHASGAIRAAGADPPRRWPVQRADWIRTALHQRPIDEQPPGRTIVRADNVRPIGGLLTAVDALEVVGVGKGAAIIIAAVRAHRDFIEITARVVSLGDDVHLALRRAGRLHPGFERDRPAEVQQPRVAATPQINVGREPVETDGVRDESGRADGVVKARVNVDERPVVAVARQIGRGRTGIHVEVERVIRERGIGQHRVFVISAGG